MDLWSVKLQSRCVYDDVGQQNNSISTGPGWFNCTVNRSWSCRLSEKVPDSKSSWLLTDQVRRSSEQNWLEGRRTELPSVSHFLFFYFWVHRGHSLPMVILPLALICLLVLKDSLPPPPFSHFIALWLSLILTLPSLHLCHIHSLLIGLFIFISALFISSSVLLFHASSVCLSVSSAGICLCQSIFIIFSPPPLLTPTHSLCSRRPHFLVLSLSRSCSDVSRESMCLVAEVECLMHVFH